MKTTPLRNTVLPKNTNNTNSNDRITNVTNNEENRKDEIIEVMETSQSMDCHFEMTIIRNKRTAQASPTHVGFKKVERPAKKKADKLKTLTKQFTPYNRPMNLDNKNKIK